MLISSLDLYFLEEKKLKNGKKLLKLRFLDKFSKTESEKYDQDWNVADKFGVITPR